MLHGIQETPLLCSPIHDYRLTLTEGLTYKYLDYSTLSRHYWSFIEAPIACISFANIKMAPTLGQLASVTLLGLSTLFNNVHAAPVLPSGWSPDGCYVDNVSGRILSYQFPDNQALTVESCIASCSGAGKGYTVAGMEYGVQCFCDTAIINGGKPAAAQTDCNVACGGNSAEQCGGGNRMNIYSTGTLQTRGPPGPQKTGLPGSWAYKGCIT